jgi:uncharacterized protein Veg
VLKPGDTFHFENHLWVVIAETYASKLICVSFTSRDERKECHVMCKEDEHSSFTHDTVVAYNYARIFTKNIMKSYLDGGTFLKKKRCSRALLEKVRTGVALSKRIKNFIRDEYNAAQPLSE